MSSRGLLMLKHIGIIFLATMVVNFSNYLFHVFMGRMLGPASYGILVSLLSISVILSVPVATLQTVITKYVSNFKAKNQYAEISYLFFRLIKKLFFYGILGFILFALGSGYLSSFLQISSPVPVIILGTSMIFAIILPIVYGVLQGLQSFGHLGFNMIVSGISRLVLGLLLVYLGLGVSGAIAAPTLAGLFAVALAFIPLRFLYRWRGEDPQINSGEMYRYFWPVLMSFLCFAILTNTDVILVKHFFTPLDAGRYSAAAMMGKIVLFLPGAIGMVMFPKTSELHALERDSFPLLRKSLFLVGAMCGLVTAGYFLFPRFAITFLFGNKYLPGAPLIGIFGVAMTLFALIQILILYHLSVHNLNFVYFLATFSLLQVILLWFFHNSLSQIIYILIANGSLLFTINWLLAHRRVQGPVEKLHMP